MIALLLYTGVRPTVAYTVGASLDALLLYAFTLIAGRYI